MNPEQVAMSKSEHAEQSALFCWANMAVRCGFIVADNMLSYTLAGLADVREIAIIDKTLNPVPELMWLHAIPNAGARGNKVAASQLKAEGVKAGVADICWPVISVVRSCRYSGLYIELKKLDGKFGDYSKEQLEFARFVMEQGFAWMPAFGWREGARVLKEYCCGRRNISDKQQEVFDRIARL